jgi:glutaredoxin-related protein
MNNYYIHSVILQDCSYSNAVYKLLKNYPKIKTNITFVNDSNKENYKTYDIQTFPQIYLKRYNKNGSLLIGGYTELKELFDLFYKTKYSNNKIIQIINNNNRWSKKSLLRFIHLINS